MPQPDAPTTFRLVSTRNLALVAAVVLAIAGGVTLELRLIAASMAVVFGLVVVTVLKGIATGELPFKGRLHVYDDSPSAFVIALLSYVFMGAALAYFGLELVLS